jgi:hypothetical protein
VLGSAPSATKSNDLGPHFRQPLQNGLVDSIIHENRHSGGPSAEFNGAFVEADVEVDKAEAVARVRRFEGGVLVVLGREYSELRGCGFRRTKVKGGAGVLGGGRVEGAGGCEAGYTAGAMKHLRSKRTD